MNEWPDTALVNLLADLYGEYANVLNDPDVNGEYVQGFKAGMERCIAAVENWSVTA